jgi:hypothetical protein
MSVGLAVAVRTGVGRLKLWSVGCVVPTGIFRVKTKTSVPEWDR